MLATSVSESTPSSLSDLTVLRNFQPKTSVYTAYNFVLSFGFEIIFPFELIFPLSPTGC